MELVLNARKRLLKSFAFQSVCIGSPKQNSIWLFWKWKLWWKHENLVKTILIRCRGLNPNYAACWVKKDTNALCCRIRSYGNLSSSSCSFSSAFSIPFQLGFKMLVCWKSDGYSCGKSIYQIFEALSLYTILFNYSTFYLGFVGVTFFHDSHWAWLGLGKKLNWFSVLMNSLLSVKSLQRRQRIRIIFQQFHQCRSPPPCPPPSARPYSSWRSTQISGLGEMKEPRARMQVGDCTSFTSADAWSIVI